MRLIDADAFDRDLCNHKFTAALNEAADAGTAFEDKEMYYSTQSFRDVMKYRPTIDAVPVVHGYWELNHEKEWCCSACGYAPVVYEGSNYCGFCGAKMDLEEKPNGTDNP